MTWGDVDVYFKDAFPLQNEARSLHHFISKMASKTPITSPDHPSKGLSNIPAEIILINSIWFLVFILILVEFLRKKIYEPRMTDATKPKQSGN